MRRTPAILWVALLAAAGLAGHAWWRQARLERSQDEVIRRAAAQYKVDPALVKAVVWRESRFDSQARGSAGELGLMQLQEIAAQEWADAERIPAFRHAHCLDATTNILAGTFYLGKLLQRYRHTDDPIPYALADYNAGRANVLRWIEGRGATNSTVFIEQIGFPLTRRYVIEVMRRSKRYRF
ncbi:MAG: lytic transglycosylase domain-containing protein [Verrucomicrobia bacterium]|jgi:soluble lytic murein transglycosylase|nr:lytic transglycosylase domain-containing protein [Verrucomicrobiota bacterium]